MDTWGVTVADVLELSGTVVTTSNIAVAAGIINLYSNRTEATSGNLRARDYAWIQAAVNYQAAWVASHIGIAGRDLVSELVQDGTTSRNYDGNNSMREWSITLSPLAARALKNLSWKGRKQEGLGHRVCGLSPFTAANDPGFINEDGMW